MKLLFDNSECGKKRYFDEALRYIALELERKETTLCEVWNYMHKMEKQDLDDIISNLRNIFRRNYLIPLEVNRNSYIVKTIDFDGILNADWDYIKVYADDEFENIEIELTVGTTTEYLRIANI